MPTFLYADSPGGLGQEGRAYDSARTDRFFRSIQAQDARAAMEQAWQQDAQKQAMEMAKLIENNRRFRLQGMQDQVSQQYSRSQDTLKYLFQNRELEQKAKLAQMEFDAVGGQRDAVRGQQDYIEARKAIEEGLLTPEQLPQAFPNLPPNLQSRLGMYRGNLAHEEQQEADLVEGDAADQNERLSLMRLTKGLADAKAQADKAKRGWNWLPVLSGMKPWKSERQIDEALAAKTKNLMEGRGRGEVDLPPSQISDFMNLVFKNKRLSESIRWNSDKEAFEPVPVPRRFALSRSPVGALPAAPTVVPAAAVGTGSLTGPAGFQPTGKPHVDMVYKLLISGVPFDQAVAQVKALRSL